MAQAACLTMSHKTIISIYPVAEKILYLREQKLFSIAIWRGSTARRRGF